MGDRGTMVCSPSSVWGTPDEGQPQMAARPGATLPPPLLLSLMQPPADFMKIGILLLWIRFLSDQLVEPDQPMRVHEGAAGADCLRVPFSTGKPRPEQAR